MTDFTHAALRPEHPAQRSLAQMAAEFGIDFDEPAESVFVSGITLSSQGVLPGDLYVGLPGRRAHGAEYAADAAERGAVALLTDERGAELARDSGLPTLVVADPRQALGEVAAWIYRTREDPPTLFGVTGTNGKTSVAYLLEAVLGQLGIVAGLSTTAERRIGDIAVASSLTTPEATEIHGLLARMRELDARAVVLEVSAQALTQHRVDGVRFDIVGFTNLSHDHLDDYQTMESYFAAKEQLFQPDRAERGVALVDDEWGRRLSDTARIPLTTISSTGTEADWRVDIVDEQLDRTSFTLTGPDARSITTSVPLLGRYMAANAALAIVMLVESGFDIGAIDFALQRDDGITAYIPGRVERIAAEKGPAVFIDYGHTPDAFTGTLSSLRRLTRGRIIFLFGADGDRDPSKREEMGAIAARLADVVVVTDFHPRFEDPAAIRRSLIEGARAARPDVQIHEVPDPRAALRAALALAEPDDIVLYAGPGHEEYHEVAGVKHPYSARDDARLALHEAGRH